MQRQREVSLSRQDADFVLLAFLIDEIEFMINKVGGILLHKVGGKGQLVGWCHAGLGDFLHIPEETQSVLLLSPAHDE